MRVGRYTSGFDSFTPDAGQQEMMHCRACHAKMNVERGVVGARSYASAMAGSKSKYDHFTCPHAGEAWHNQLIDLLQEQRKTSSHQIATMLGSEITTVRQNRMPTLSRYVEEHELRQEHDRMMSEEHIEG